MADIKDGESFFRKVVRFVANPSTDWAELGSRQDDTRELDLERSELKAMVERKRRNDFVRRREFDMLRKVRREGLSPEQLAALGVSSRIDDSELRQAENTHARPEVGVKAKIDEIEQQMVGGALGPATHRPSGFFSAPTEPAVLARSGLPPPSAELPLGAKPEELPALPKLQDPELGRADTAAAAFSAPGLPPLAPLSMAAAGDAGEFTHRFGVEVSEVVHDPDLDEAVITFANADFGPCEQSLTQLTAAGGARAQHAETWLVLFDLYRATGQQQRFDSLAADYAHQFGWSAPQWFSLPSLVADGVADASPVEPGTPAPPHSEVGWICPDLLDTDAVARLRSQTLQLPLPWVFDWTALRRIDAEAATQLAALLRHWGKQPLEMRWIGGETLFGALHEAAPTGMRDADPAFWQARLEALKLAHRADQFDEAAIDYCVTYEVSPPSWERSRCQLRISDSGLSTHPPALSMVSQMSTGFMESRSVDDAGSASQFANIELSGQLVGDVSATLQRLDAQLGQARVVNVCCAKLIRVDFIAAGDLLNWVLAKRSENRAVQFVDAHRLVALFFGAMGINEHARVQVRKV